MCICFNVFSFHLLQLTIDDKSPDEYGLNIDADVALWLDSRAYNYYPPLRQFCDFVFVTSVLHQEFDVFKQKETTPGHSTLPLAPLLDYWNKLRSSPLPVIRMFGKLYLKLNSSDTDELYQWIYNTREKLQDNPVCCTNFGRYHIGIRAAYVSIQMYIYYTLIGQVTTSKSHHVPLFRKRRTSDSPCGIQKKMPGCSKVSKK